MTPKNCAGCEHPLYKHYRALDESVRCMCGGSSTSTSGVTGLVSHWECDCKDFVSVRAAESRTRQRAEQQERADFTKRLVAEIERNGLKPLPTSEKPGQ